MLEVLIVGAGGFLGTVCRYLLGMIPYQSEFPLITFGINLIGSFIIGFIAGMMDKKVIDERMGLFLKTGFCGGFTTFSAFSLETLNLFKQKHYFTGTAYAFLSVVVCVIGAWLGLLVSKKINLN